MFEDIYNKAFNDEMEKIAVSNLTAVKAMLKRLVKPKTGFSPSAKETKLINLLKDTLKRNPKMRGIKKTDVKKSVGIVQDQTYSARLINSMIEDFEKLR